MPPVVEGAPRRFKHGFARIVHFPLENMRVESMLPALSKIATHNSQPRIHNFFSMSQHRSLKGTSTIAAKRNVLKRFERVELLKKRGQFKSGDKVIGLRKTKPDA
jgi:small basic protein (TIGR04137 family)